MSLDKLLINQKLTDITIGQLAQLLKESGAGRMSLSQDYISGKRHWVLVMAHNDSADRLSQCIKQLDAEDLAAEVEES
ncbi:hypothetical protein [Pseudanabaena sp. FACHB-2040]|uniref:hypothetical protein n=1 Tax=Pseudanabaena sp. FACHB-2040 TaxID=2692859 RepID=UPI0016863AC8|nr:hypothetical protein [Pseudanabaena sp. FACHB-2040]MBD2261407.1 hypothetical protein [Pseudanabaena sp. FACHB-2040]